MPSSIRAAPAGFPSRRRSSPCGERRASSVKTLLCAGELDRPSPLGRPVIKQDAQLHGRDDERCPGTEPARAPGEQRRERSTTRPGAHQKNPPGNPPTSGAKVHVGPSRPEYGRGRRRASRRRTPTQSPARNLAREIVRSKPSPARTARPRLHSNVYRAGTRKYPNARKTDQAEIALRPPLRHRRERETDRDRESSRAASTGFPAVRK